MRLLVKPTGTDLKSVFLDYWLDELGLYGPFGYMGVLKEKDMARNCLAPCIFVLVLIYARDMGFEELNIQKSMRKQYKQ